MSYEVPGYSIGTLLANADLRTKKGSAVKLAGAGAIDLVTVAGETAIGVLLNSPNIGETAKVGCIGVFPVLSGAAVAINTKISPDATGRFITPGAAAAGQVGFAFEAAAGAGVMFTAFVNCGAGKV